MKRNARIWIMSLIIVLVLVQVVGCSSNENRYDYSGVSDGATTETTTETTTSSSDRNNESNVIIQFSEEVGTQYSLSLSDRLDEDERTSPLLSGESYQSERPNPFVDTYYENTSTFSIDVDTASYSNIRRMIEDGLYPEPDAVRIEEMINYFDYDYPEPVSDLPFSIYTSTTVCPWNEDNMVTLIGLRAEDLKANEIPPSNIVLLIDVSGSMNADDKLPLLKEGFKALAENFTDEDVVSIVVYAGAAGVVLDGADGDDYRKISRALDSLSAGGSTAGGEGIELAYDIASDYYIPGGNNRVILATDGDFNVGMSSVNQLEDYIEEKRNEDIFLSVLGFGTGNVRDDVMETLADKGNGNYAYIDSYDEALKVLDKEFMGTMFAVAKDVKIQVAFNENVVEAYKLIGYENRVMANEDFENDRKDAGELGAGHEVTALYELVLVNPDDRIEEALYDVKIRYKEPDEETSEGIQVVEKTHEIYMDPYGDPNILWALSVAEFGMIIRGDRGLVSPSLERIYDQAQYCYRENRDEYYGEFLDLVNAFSERFGDDMAGNSDDYKVVYID